METTPTAYAKECGWTSQIENAIQDCTRPSLKARHFNVSAPLHPDVMPLTVQHTRCSVSCISCQYFPNILHSIAGGATAPHCKKLTGLHSYLLNHFVSSAERADNTARMNKYKTKLLFISDAQNNIQLTETEWRVWKLYDTYGD